jgi:enterochelin esterase family protein
MKRIIYLAMFVGFLLGCSPAESPKGTLTTRSFTSEALQKDMNYNIYLPYGYEKDTARYPVLYLLHGYTGNHTDWAEKGHAAQTLDRLIADGSIAPMIVVMPDAGNSWYVDSDSTESWGAYETAVIRDLRKHVESGYRTVDSLNSRYIAGLSMGGYGTLHLAFKYPELFKAAASMSGAFMPAFPVGYDILEGVFGNPADPDKYQQQNPFNLVTKDSLKQMPVYITCGDDDYRLFHYSIDMYDTLTSKGYDAELRITDGAHEWPVWEQGLEQVLQFFEAQP